MAAESGEKAFYTLEVEGKKFGFRRPSVEQIDLSVGKAKKGALSAAIGFTKALVMGEKTAWEEHVADQPGAAVTAMNEILEALGFQTGA